MDIDIDIDVEEIVTDLSPPQNSSVVSFITVVLLLVGVYYAIQGVYRVFPLVISVSLCLLGLDGTRNLSTQLQQKQKIEADYFISYMLGSVLIFIGLLLSRQLHWYQLDLPVFSDFMTAFLGSISVSAIYVVVLTILMRTGDQPIIVKKDPYNPTDRFYIFTEEEYIQRVEDRALEKAKNN